MQHQLPELPYDYSTLSPYISAETLEFHHGKHHRAYVDNLNGLITGTEFDSMTLAEIVRSAPAGAIFNNAAQIHNHSFYFFALSNVTGSPSELLFAEISKAFGDLDSFKKAFAAAALKNFGSGWTWLVWNIDTSALEILNTSNAETPLTNHSLVPLFTCDVWEHAYYVDYRNRRAEYVEKFWNVLNWKVVSDRFEASV